MDPAHPEFHLLRWFESTFGKESEAYLTMRSAFEDTPGRVARAFSEMLSGYMGKPEDLAKPTVELKKSEMYQGLVAAREIYFVSMCAHHMLPFSGHVDLAYQPGAMIVGIGKLPRLVELRARRLQIQEQLARDICIDLMRVVGARGAVVKTTAKHLCVCARGPNKPEVYNVASYSAGSLSHLRDAPI